MFALTAKNAAAYLGRPCQAAELGGGVSNTVILVEDGADRIVLKQSLGKLRVKEEWYSDRGRIFRESAAMRRLGTMVPEGSVPVVLFEDRENFLFAMTAASKDAQTWKDRLLRGLIDERTARQAATILGRIISATWKDRGSESEFGDQTVFDELRIDPYYRSTASRNPDLAGYIHDLIRTSSSRRVCLVHGDFSPKNFMISPERAMLIDFEVIHYGDPAFDAAFLLNHLLLKSLFLPQWRAAFRAASLTFWQVLGEYLPSECDWFASATIQHLGVLMLARVDGKSPVEYIRTDSLRHAVRALAGSLIRQPPRTIESVWDRLVD